MPLRIVYSVMLLLITGYVSAQSCGRLGQTPASAYTICGNGTQSIAPSSSCFNGSFFLPGCTNENTSYGDLNGVYFKFTCKTAGSLAFFIAAWKPEDDINWQLFDITGKNPNEIFTDRFLTIAGNWSGTIGPTGASAQGSSLIQCRTFAGQGNPANTFSSMPQLKENHTYLLMVANLSFPGGFALTVDGGSADISGDIAVPLKAETASCNQNQMMLVFSKPVQCSSITSSGSEFLLVPGASAISNIRLFNCSTAGETDSVLLQFAQPLPFGSYSLLIKNGTDGNTVRDNCGNIIPLNTEIKFNVTPYPQIDSISITSCRPDKLTLLLSKQTLCNSIAADGSDFSITGPSAVTVQSATIVCSNGTANQIELVLQNPITVNGNYNLQLKTGSDGSTITDVCNNTSPVGSGKSFRIKGVVDPDFNISIAKGCIADTVSFVHAGGNEINQWNWNFSNNTGSNQQQPVVLFTNGGTQTASLYVSNGQCFANLEKTFVLEEKLKADFDIPAIGCSNQLITITDKSIAALTYEWNFGNGNISNQPNPPAQTYTTAIDKNFAVILTVQKNGCVASTAKSISVKAGCFVSLPNAFTPNNDGLNDLFGPLNGFGVSDLQFRIFNRMGEQVFQAAPTVYQWNGDFKNQPQPAGLYTWTLHYTDPFAGKKITQKGTVMLIR
ncbi:gliding motility-associated C-terminal domain-containing protein [Lacibacter sp. MH-610]|uniref:T9SS type B sorting domain-containing protein n=1 Tax=Lacibacter sp. MH-610 TaxID=3020883 RepID=UPI0038928281